MGQGIGQEMRALNEREVQERLALLSGWTLAQGTLMRQMKFSSFESAIGFVTRLALLAQHEQHHPDIHIQFCTVTLTLSTHDVGGLSTKDFYLAQKINELH